MNHCDTVHTQWNNQVHHIKAIQTIHKTAFVGISLSTFGQVYSVSRVRLS